METIDRLIITSPYAEPSQHWQVKDGQWSRAPGRRAAGYVKFNPKAQGGLSQDLFVPLEAVNEIRRRVRAWREAGRPNATRVTRALLEHWAALECPRPFFCQLEAIETLIWLTEAPAEARQGLEAYGLKGDGSAFRRVCTKLCTGGGKTTVMAMLIAWHACNKEVYPQNPNYCRDILVVAPNLTVRERLTGLDPHARDNEYAAFSLVPPAYADGLERARVRILNWQAMKWEDAAALKRKRSVDKRGPLSDVAYARTILGPELSRAPRLLVINDEAHHAWRLPPKGLKDLLVDKEAKEEATVWIGGLDRLHRAIGIHTCHDFSATPFVPSGKMGKEDFLFHWIVSDFGLNDGIEAGLVKTPRMVARANGALDAETFRPKLVDLYEHLKEGIGNGQPPDAPLDPLLCTAYALLAKDWQDTASAWQAAEAPTPPVMISVVNNTTTARRVERHFLSHPALLPEPLCEETHVLRIDSEALEKAASKEGNSSAKQEAEALRLRCNTVGKVGQPGAQVCNLVSVAMLSEGWDAKTVTHILGLRAFTSQLLCEQVIGRGLRRTSYDLGADGLLTPQYVQVMGVPFRFLPAEDGGEGSPTQPKPTFEIAVTPGREAAEIRWPNILRIDDERTPDLTLADTVPSLTLSASDLPTKAEMEDSLSGWLLEDTRRLISLSDHPPRRQTLCFHVVKDLLGTSAFMTLKQRLTMPRLFARLAGIVEAFASSGKCQWEETLEWHGRSPEDPETRLAYAFNVGRIAEHLRTHLSVHETIRHVAILDRRRPELSTAHMPTWRTQRERFVTSEKCQIGHAVYDSTWEAEVALEIEHHPAVEAYVRNDRHIGLRVRYPWEGAIHDYLPDFVVRLTNGTTAILEVKGRQDERTAKKHAALERWCAAVTELGRFGVWRKAVVLNPKAICAHLDRLALR